MFSIRRRTGGLAEDHALDALELAAGLALDEVAEGGEGGAAEADEGDAVGEGALAGADGVEHVAEVLVRVAPAQGLDVGFGAHGGGDHGGGFEADVDAEGVEDHEDVGEEDRRVDAEEVDGLEGDLGAQVGRCGTAR
jgi:hypothetical protein